VNEVAILTEPVRPVVRNAWAENKMQSNNVGSNHKKIFFLSGVPRLKSIESTQFHGARAAPPCIAPAPGAAHPSECLFDF
jgi:hypothetical protein